MGFYLSEVVQDLAAISSNTGSTAAIAVQAFVPKKGKNQPPTLAGHISIQSKPPPEKNDGFMMVNDHS